MNKLISISDIWENIFLPLLEPKIHRISELRSVCRQFSKLFKPLNILHIRVTDELSLQDAYTKICIYIEYLEDISVTNNTSVHDLNYKSLIPEIWLGDGIYINEVESIKYPITIRGMGNKRTIIDGGLNFKINSEISSQVYDLNITNEKGVGIHNYRQSEIVISSCYISNCIYGIQMSEGKITMKNSKIFNNKNGINLWGKNTGFNFSEIEVCNNVCGIIIGRLNEPNETIIRNLICHHNSEIGIGVGGYMSNTSVILSGDKTDIYSNNSTKHKYGSGVEITYNGTIEFVGLDKSVSHDNNTNWLNRWCSSSNIMFI